ncbi:MAG: hypothetical protein ACI4MG_04890 [Aristaeellaceae bacterium]
MKIKKTKGDIVFDVLNTIFMLFMIIVTLYPMYYVVIASVSDNTRLQAFKGIMLLPQGFTLGAYKLTFQHPLILSGFKNILTILAIYLPLSLLMTVLCANFMAAKDVKFKKPLVLFIMFTMYFFRRPDSHLPEHSRAAPVQHTLGADYSGLLVGVQRLYCPNRY